MSKSLLHSIFRGEHECGNSNKRKRMEIIERNNSSVEVSYLFNYIHVLTLPSCVCCLLWLLNCWNRIHYEVLLIWNFGILAWGY